MIFGLTFIALGLVCAVYTVYELWWTNIEAENATVESRNDAQSYIDSATHSRAAERNAPPVQPPINTPFAFMYIPRLRDRVWRTPIVQGVTPIELGRGLGHYEGTAMPGQAGNFAVAGHRATHGEPFTAFDQLRNGDNVFVHSAAGWFTYVLRKDQLVLPRETWVIDPLPTPAAGLGSDHLITLTTCNPQYGSTQRWAYWGILKGVRTPAEGPPAEVTR